MRNQTTALSLRVGYKVSTILRSVARLATALCLLTLFASELFTQQIATPNAAAVGAENGVTKSAGNAKVSASQQSRIAQKQYNEPLRFEPNHGQSDKRVQFFSAGRGYSFFLSPGEAVLSLRTKTGIPAYVQMTTIGGNRAAKATGSELLAAKTNYIIGNNPASWRQNVPNFQRVPLFLNGRFSTSRARGSVKPSTASLCSQAIRFHSKLAPMTRAGRWSSIQ